MHDTRVYPRAWPALPVLREREAPHAAPVRPVLGSSYRARCPDSGLVAGTDGRADRRLLLATEGAYQRISESRGAPAVPHHLGRVGSQRTGCSNSHRFSSPAIPRFGCSLPMAPPVCLVSLLTRKPIKCLAPHSFSEIWLFAPPVSRFTVNKKAMTPCVSRFTVNPSVCLVSLLTRKPS